MLAGYGDGEGRTGEYVDADEFVRKLDDRIRVRRKFKIEKSFDRDVDRINDKGLLSNDTSANFDD